MWWLVCALLFVPQASAPNPYREAGAALASGDLTAAQARLEELTVKDPANARAWMLLAQTYAGARTARRRSRQRPSPRSWAHGTLRCSVAWPSCSPIFSPI